jgi:hypothetical protein
MRGARGAFGAGHAAIICDALRVMGALRIAAVVLACLVLLVLLVVVAAIFTGLHRMTEYNVMYATVRAPRAKITDIYPALKTGDILLFVASTGSPSNSFLTQSFHSHAGVLVREGELVYISEAQPGLEIMPDPEAPATSDLRMSRGAVLAPLLTRLKYYTGVYYVMRLARPLDAAREELLKAEAERLQRVQYPYPTLSQIFLGITGHKTATRHCFQHTAHLLDRALLTPKGAPPLGSAGFVDVCRTITGLPGRLLRDGHRYLSPVQLLYDIGTISA